MNDQFHDSPRHNNMFRIFLSSFRIIPVFCWTCMSLFGCDVSDEQSLQTNAPPSIGLPSRGAAPIKSPNVQRSTHPVHSAKHEEFRIVAFGDSLTAGLGVSPEESYPSQLQQRIDEAGYPYRVINAGVSGDTTAGALRRLKWILKSHPQIVIIELGANDGLRGHPLKTTYKNLRQILQQLKEADIQIILTGMKIPPNYGIDYTSKFTGMYTQLAEEFNVTFMPFFLEDVAAQRTLNQADGIHPTGEGYTIIVDNVFSILEPLLKTRTPNAS